MFKSISGREGFIEIAKLGAVIGQLSQWRLYRDKLPNDDEHYSGTFTFQAECEYINPVLFNDPDYDQSVVVIVKRDRKRRVEEQYRLEQEQGQKRTLTGRSLLLEGVRLCKL